MLWIVGVAADVTVFRGSTNRLNPRCMCLIDTSAVACSASPRWPPHRQCGDAGSSHGGAVAAMDPRRRFPLM